MLRPGALGAPPVFQIENTMNSFLTRTFAIALAFAFVVSIAGCGAGAPTQAPPEADEKAGVSDGTVTQAEE